MIGFFDIELRPQLIRFMFVLKIFCIDCKIRDKLRWVLFIPFKLLAGMIENNIFFLKIVDFFTVSILKQFDV